MTAVLVSAAAAVIAAGAYLRWALAPVRGAYRLGEAMGRRERQHSTGLLIRTVAYLTGGGEQ